ncbi:probable E3 ubiquitin-protein ligase HECTD2 isoform X2 [Nematostella vectensis]|uniref:probable E3 ubiquitin-protein ligase HECTD2 isoform X2 n=1 Tax=Nematostella vectensis TaxID=45351 RepID=UPI002076FC92|nr:probable E3 ubiquitin-protein ligase HECTD2 isoform X2 [Nematostella vectensis]
MFGGGKNRLLPPIKNPLFNPNAQEGSDEVRVAEVTKTPPERSKGRLSSLFSSKNRKSAGSSRSNVFDENSDSKLGASCSDTLASNGRPSSSRHTQATSTTKQLPPQKSNEGKGKTLLNSRAKFSRNLNTEEDKSTPECASLHTEQAVQSSPERKSPGLLKRDKEKPMLLSREKEENGKLLSVENSNSRARSRPSSCSDIQKSVKSSSQNDPENSPEKARYTDALSLRNDWRTAKASGDYKGILAFLSATFDSVNEINAVFMKREDCLGPEDEDGSGLDYDFIRITYDIVLTLPQEVQKAVLKSVINSLLQDLKRQRTKQDIRAYIVLLQNPQFNKATTYVIFAHLLRQVSSLSDAEHQLLVRWLRKIPLNTFQATVTRVQQFISTRMFPTNSMELPPEEKCTWWIPSAVKVLALLNAANWLVQAPLVLHTYFYNHSLDHIDLMAEYYSWQNPGANSGKFSFCQYPFILSLGAKRYIMQKDSESQMIVMARVVFGFYFQKSLMEKVQRREMPDMGMLFLNIKVRRSHLITDSLNEIARKQKNLKKKLKVTFAGEPGLDMGGLTKEWFLLLVRKIFKPEYGMFSCNDKSRLYWFNKECLDQDEEFNLVGVLMGLAVYNSIILDIHFPSCCYKKLLSPAVVPFHNPNARVGLANLGLEDLAEVMPELARGLKELLSYEGDVENDLCQTFQVSFTSYGEVVTHNLKPKGDTIPVTNTNRQEYVQLYVDYLLNSSIYKQFEAFYHGFHSVCASNALIMLRPEEVEMLVCGNPELDMEALKKVTVYDGYSKNDNTIRYFWDTVMNFNTDLKKKMLLFATGSDRIPIGGMAEMEFKIVRMDTAHSTSMLPMAHTCFNQLCLPPYKTRKQIKQKLTIAISNAEGFGIE